MQNHEDLQFLAAKSHALIEKQIASHRQQQTAASAILAIDGIFIPLFVTVTEKSGDIVRYSTLLPILLLVISMIFLVHYVFRGQLLYQAMKPENFDELVNKSFEEILSFEIGSNQTSFVKNRPILAKRSKYYNRAVKLTAAAIIVSALLLIINTFIRSSTEPVKVSIVGPVIISDSARKDSSLYCCCKTDSAPKTTVIKKVYPTKKIIIQQRIGHQQIETQNIIIK